MKRLLAILMVVAMMLSASAMADGTLYEGDITFLRMPMGSLYDDVKGAYAAANPVNMGLNFDEAMITHFTRDVLEDREVMYGLRSGILQDSSRIVRCYVVGSINDEYNKVAGYDVAVTYMVFAYPTAEAEKANDAKQSTLYSARYVFTQDVGVSDAIYDDLLAKLTGLYGEPYASADHLDMIWGEVDRSQAIANFGIEDTAEAYRDIKTMLGISDHFTVLKSATNGACVVLERDAEGETLNHVTIIYFDPAMDAELTGIAAPSAGVEKDETGSTAGL